jgi:GNAT superfamily N-acetyltransferase
MGSWVVRSARELDFDGIVQFNRQLAWESEKIHLDEQILRDGVLRILRNPSLGRYFVAMDGDRVIGQTMINFEPTDWRDGIIVWLQSVYVSETYRKKGVFKALYQAIMDYCKEHAGPVRLVRLYMEQDNDQARKAYESLGMKKTHYVIYEIPPP